MTDKDLKIDFNSIIEDTKVYFYKSQGPGGQRRNKKETAVKLHHIPTGITVVATEFRSQAQNKALAFRRLKKRLIALTKKRKPRIATKLPLGIREKILEEKKIHSQIKKLRKKIKQDEEYY